MDRPQPRRILAEGRFARLVAKDGWEWVERVSTSRAVIIVAVTDDEQLVLVEQFRIPLDRRVIELPAGLVGDGSDIAREDPREAARRELLEETGYQAERLEYLAEGPSSSGLTTETYALFLARNVRRVGPGGGDGSEDIRCIWCHWAKPTHGWRPAAAKASWSIRRYMRDYISRSAKNQGSGFRPANRNLNPLTPEPYPSFRTGTPCRRSRHVPKSCSFCR